MAMGCDIKPALARSVLALAFKVQAQDRIPPPPEPAASCRAMMKEAKARVSGLPEGVERTAAEMEITNAPTELVRGAESDCKMHIRNALMGMKAKGVS